MPAIMYCCDTCRVHAPENCGRDDREELRVTPEGNWLCDGCWDAEMRGPDDSGPSWSDAPIPPAYAPVAPAL